MNKRISKSERRNALTRGMTLLLSNSLFNLKTNAMATRKDGSNQNLDERSRNLSSDYNRVNDEDNLDTREISHSVEEGDEDYDDEEQDDELTDADFAIDDEEEGDEENA
jgi:hypothetical protein